ncbi:hypothetical protein CDAR_402531 [Caerostris darwini]|uniref:Uncharacterized protein n=1 Tax=Caerostris darwini TaxID=1538125 RepID=A0AAV4RXF5_9ARAC|nr:hypothetical protein CDAR_402531 [Caerostris darwini]
MSERERGALPSNDHLKGDVEIGRAIRNRHLRNVINTNLQPPLRKLFNQKLGVNFSSLSLLNKAALSAISSELTLLTLVIFLTLYQSCRQGLKGGLSFYPEIPWPDGLVIKAKELPLLLLSLCVLPSSFSTASDPGVDRGLPSNNHLKGGRENWKGHPKSSSSKPSTTFQGDLQQEVNFSSPSLLSRAALSAISSALTLFCH